VSNTTFSRCGQEHNGDPFKSSFEHDNGMVLTPMAGMQKWMAAVAIAASASSVWLFLDNRKLRQQVQSAALADKSAVQAVDPWAGVKASPSPEPDTKASSTTRSAAISAPPPPTLPEVPTESRLERRNRRTNEFAAMFGRLDDETEEQYKARVMPLVQIGLDKVRKQAKKTKDEAFAKAGISDAQSAQLDKAFEKTYADVIDYTNGAIADGQLSPYERNVSGWLEFAGGLGGMLNESQTRAGKILSPEQMKALSASGFEWGEYLGANAPWESLRAPPPAPN
jgi:hypothetical protein